MKKILATIGLFVIMAALVVTFAACGGNDNENNGTPSNGNNGDIANVGDNSEKQTSNEDLSDWYETEEIILPEI